MEFQPNDLDYEVRIQSAIKCRQKLLPAAILIDELASTKISIDSASKIKQANELITTLADELRHIRDHIARENGPRANLDGFRNYQIFASFEQGFRIAALAVIRIKETLRRSGDLNWQYCKSEATSLRCAFRAFSDFLDLMCRLSKQDVVPTVSLATLQMKIPWEKRTVAMSKADAIQLIGTPPIITSERGARDYLNVMIESGEYDCEMIGPNRFVFNIDQFPEKYRNDIKRI
ncbi:hypothetical protein [Roseiconus lacunae]|uniref:hypothetical protein n=1 Tax=Roseiconus lacunae TaxID=2605694 RepID=UPI0011F2E480|nr:hypothetical protein [Roseiconus lacunae]